MEVLQQKFAVVLSLTIQAHRIQLAHCITYRTIKRTAKLFFDCSGRVNRRDTELDAFGGVAFFLNAFDKSFESALIYGGQRPHALHNVVWCVVGGKQLFGFALGHFGFRLGDKRRLSNVKDVLRREVFNAKVSAQRFVERCDNRSFNLIPQIT